MPEKGEKILVEFQLNMSLELVLGVVEPIE
jgi:hypothetical protein